MQLDRETVLGDSPRGDLRPATLAAMSSSMPVEAVAAIVDRLDDPLRWLEFAQRNRVGPLVAHALLDHLSGTHPARSRARAVHDESGARMRILMEELDRVAERLAREEIRLVALKNAGIARGLAPCAACCPMGDVDVLVDRARYREAHVLLPECGFALDSRSVVEPADIEAGLASGGTEYVKRVGDEEVWFELQWRPIAGRWIRADQEPSGADLLDRSVALPGTAVRLLSPEDNMLQVALHTAKHSYVRAPGLRLHTDVDRLAAFAPPDWQSVTATAEALQVATPSYFSFALARVLLGTEIPDPVLERLSPPAWKIRLIAAWLRRIDVFEPDALKFSRPAMMVFHALLYDDVVGLAASVFDTDADHLRLRDLPANLRRGAARLTDIVTRYQR